MCISGVVSLCVCVFQSYNVWGSLRLGEWISQPKNDSFDGDRRRIGRGPKDRVWIWTPNPDTTQTGLPVRTAEKRPGVVPGGSIDRHIWQSHGVSGNVMKVHMIAMYIYSTDTKNPCVSDLDVNL